MKTKTKTDRLKADLPFNHHPVRNRKRLAGSNKPVLICLLLDRSGSMIQCLLETIGGFNGYLAQLKKKQPKSTRFTLVQFDTVGVDTIHDAVPLGEVMELTKENFVPRGGTPLYDATGRTIQSAMAKAGKDYKVLFVTQTDGHENASSEWTLGTIQELIKRRETEDGWTFAHIGTGTNGWLAGTRMYHGTQSMNNVLRTSGAKMGRSMNMLANATITYTSSTSSATSTIKNLFHAGDKDNS